MKVFELVNQQSFTPKRLKTPASVKYRETLKNTDHNRELLGQGSYANVYARDNDPGAVDKVAKPISPVERDGPGKGLSDGLENDAYYKYLKLITTNDRMSSNPYFPKIFDLKTFKGNDGRYTYEVNMEKLHRLTTLSLEEVKMIGDNLFTNYRAVVKDSIEALAPGGIETEDKEMIKQITKRGHLEALSNCIQGAIENQSEPATYIKDQKLKQAVMLIRGLVKKTHPHMINDAHVGNIMVRRGPFTPQLVLTDPVS